MTRRLRTASPEDAAAIAALLVASRRAGHAGLVPQELLDRLCPEDECRRLLMALSSGGEHARVVDDGGEIVGFSSIGPARNAGDRRVSGELYALYVRPDRFRSGVGRQLLRGAMEGFRGLGYVQAFLWTLDGYEAARRFYGSGGWQREEVTARLPPPHEVPLRRYRISCGG
jgi:GNAT superfamily N-acetyltransferase